MHTAEDLDTGDWWSDNAPLIAALAGAAERHQLAGGGNQGAAGLGNLQGRLMMMIGFMVFLERQKCCIPY